MDARSNVARQFARNLHRTEVGMLERGIRLPRVDTLIKLAGSIEVEPGELLRGLDWQPAIPRQGVFRVGEDGETPVERR